MELGAPGGCALDRAAAIRRRHGIADGVSWRHLDHEGNHLLLGRSVLSVRFGLLHGQLVILGELLLLELVLPLQLALIGSRLLDSEPSASADYQTKTVVRLNTSARGREGGREGGSEGERELTVQSLGMLERRGRHRHRLVRVGDRYLADVIGGEIEAVDPHRLAWAWATTTAAAGSSSSDHGGSGCSSWRRRWQLELRLPLPLLRRRRSGSRCGWRSGSCCGRRALVVTTGVVASQVERERRTRMHTAGATTTDEQVAVVAPAGELLRGLLLLLLLQTFDHTVPVVEHLLDLMRERFA